MNLPDIILTNRTHARRILMHPIEGSALRHIISIGEEGVRPPTGFGKSKAHKIRLEFDDVEVEFLPSGYMGITEDDARRLVRFCEAVALDPGPTLVHCAAGISRSSAATLVLLAALLGPGREAEAVAHLVDVAERSSEAGHRHPADGIRPNRRVVWICDQLLGREGRLLGALLGSLGSLYSRPWGF